MNVDLDYVQFELTEGSKQKWIQMVLLVDIQHIIGLRLCALFRLVAKMVYNECFDNKKKKIKRKRNRGMTTK